MGKIIIDKVFLLLLMFPIDIAAKTLQNRLEKKKEIATTNEKVLQIGANYAKKLLADEA